MDCRLNEETQYCSTQFNIYSWTPWDCLFVTFKFNVQLLVCCISQVDYLSAHQSIACCVQSCLAVGYFRKLQQKKKTQKKNYQSWFKLSVRLSAWASGPGARGGGRFPHWNLQSIGTWQDTFFFVICHFSIKLLWV